MKKNDHMALAEWLVTLLDSRFSILGFKFGLDPLLGIVPVFGDFIAFIPSLYLVFLANHYQLPTHARNRMIFNVVLDFLVGSIPVLGFLADIAIKANEKNLKILKKYMNAEDEVIEGVVIE